MSAYYALVTMGLCLLMGYAGQVSMGQAGFFAIGGYSAAVIAALAATAQGWIANAASWLSIPAAIVITALVAFLIGIPVLRLRGHYLAMATLAFGIIVLRIVLGTPLLGAADGISDVRGFTLFASLAITGRKAARVQNYYIAWTIVALGLLLATNLVHSRAGRALRAINGNEEAASAMGVDAARLKLATFVLSAIYAAVGGACIAHYNGGIGPSEASVMKSVRYVALVAVGGMGNLGGTLAVSTALTFLSLRGVFGLYDDAVFGAILVLVMLFAPNGFFQLLGLGLGRRTRGRR
jgi:branched-chain amino acid transport system permease protein